MQPSLSADFIKDCFSHLSLEDQYKLLQRIIQVGAEAPELDELISDWLHAKQRGYTRLFDALKEKPERYERMAAAHLIP